MPSKAPTCSDPTNTRLSELVTICGQPNPHMIYLRTFVALIERRTITLFLKEKVVLKLPAPVRWREQKQAVDGRGCFSAEIAMETKNMEILLGTSIASFLLGALVVIFLTSRQDRYCLQTAVEKMHASR